MPIPSDQGFPVKRPSFIQSAEWQGPDDQLSLKLTFFNAQGNLNQIVFATRNVGQAVQGEICLPVSQLNNDLTNLGPRYEDILRAHTRMACLVAGQAVPGSQEFTSALLSGQTQNLQTAMGVTKVNGEPTPLTDQTCKIPFRTGTGPVCEVEVDYADLCNYQFAPETQLLSVPGSVRKAFSTYVHDYPTTILSATRREEIVEYVMSLTPWI